MQGLQSAGGVAEAFRQHVPVLAELAVAATSGDVAQSARQKEALKDTCVCFEQLAQVANPLAKPSMTDLCFLSHGPCKACCRPLPPPQLACLLRAPRLALPTPFHVAASASGCWTQQLPGPSLFDFSVWLCVWTLARNGS